LAPGPGNYAAFDKWHLKEHRDWAKAGRPLLNPEEVRESEAWLDLHGKGLPDVATRAKYADAHWGSRLEGWHADASRMDVEGAWSSLRGLYRYVYRRGSQATHSHHRGLDPFVTVSESRCELHRERVPEAKAVWEIAPRILLFGIGPSEATIGWPSYVAAREIVQRCLE